MPNAWDVGSARILERPGLPALASTSSGAAADDRCRSLHPPGPLPIEDWSGSSIYDIGLASERVGAAVDAAAGRLVITARAENHIHGVDDLNDTIARLQAYEQAGADVLFAPGLRSPPCIRTVLEDIASPLSVLAMPGAPPVCTPAELSSRGLHPIGVRRSPAPRP